MERIAGIKMRYQNMLYEPRLLFRYRKDCIAFLIAFRLYNSYKSKSIKGEDVKKDIAAIRLYDKKFAESVESILHLVGKSSDEVEYLARYRNDAANWHRYDDTYLIDFFVRRIYLFLDGGVEGDVRFMGLYKDFGDSKLRKAVLSNNAIRNLWLYPYQLKYLYQLIGMCLKAQKSDEWTGFYGKKGFWTDFKKYVKAFEKGYGNSDFAEKLREKRKETGNELPQYWGGEWRISNIQNPNILHQRGEVYIMIDGVYHTLVKDGELPKLLRELQDHVYHKQRIVLPAAEILQSIFKAREYELKEDFIKKFSRLLRRKRKSVTKNLKKEMNMFITHITEPWNEYSNFLEKLDNVAPKMEWWYIDRETGKLFNAAARYRTYIKQQLSRGNLLRDLTGLIQTEAADVSRVEAKRRIWQYQTFNHLTEEDFANMQKLILIAERVNSKLRAIESYVVFQLAGKYTLRLKDMRREDFTRLNNRNFQFSYVKNVFRRLIY